MKKKHIVMAAVLAVIIFLAIIGIIISSSSERKELVTIELQPASSPNLDISEVPESTVSATPVNEHTPERESNDNVLSTKEVESKENGNAAFNMKIKNSTISVAKGVDEKLLDRTPGWLTTSASPGTEGMCVVYGHRNRTHLRVLEKVDIGDPIIVTMPNGTVYTYIIKQTMIYEKTEDLQLPLTSGKSICLVTCYPFRYSGHAPGKFVVIAQLK